MPGAEEMIKIYERLEGGAQKITDACVRNLLIRRFRALILIELAERREEIEKLFLEGDDVFTYYGCCP